MPNGGHISCGYCTYGRSEKQCDVHGTPVSPHLLCRSFRTAGQSHTEARRVWPMLLDLEPGTVYKIDNNAPSLRGPKPAFKIVRLEQ